MPKITPDPGNEKFNYFIEHLPAGVIVHDSSGKIKGANTLASSLLGIPIDQMIGKSAHEDVWTFVMEDDTPMQRSDFPAIKSLQSGFNLQHIVVGVKSPNHEQTNWLICNTVITRDIDHNIETVIVSFTDFTELKSAQRALKASEERLNLILLGTNDAPWDWNLISNDIYYSDKWWAMLGRNPGELPSDHELWHRLLHPDDVFRVGEIFSGALKQNQNYEVEFRLQHKDGNYVPILSRGFVSRDKDGKAIRVSGTNTDLTERKKTEHRIHELAYFDPLTGLPNRRHLLEHLQIALNRAARTGHIGAVLFLDLDNFKDLNDTLGHDVGDLVLRQLADRLRDLLRESDHLARLGGDEFVIVVEDYSASSTTVAEIAASVARKLVEAASTKFTLPNRDYVTAASVGISLFGKEASTVDTVLKQADLAMYHAKAAGRGVSRFFDPEMQRTVDARTALEIALRSAVAENAFELYCQPQFDGEKNLYGGEMLLRWQHPEKGTISPAAFIPVAEACGLMVPIGLWVMREAFRTIASWSGHPVLGRLTFSINVSAQQLHHKEFVHQTIELLSSTNLDPSRICLELTESLLAQDVTDASEKMHALRSHGIQFSIDDFGTGYSSLSYLQRFPLTALKIDKIFVNDENAGAIVEMILALSKSLNLNVIAEGVETQSQYLSLKNKGCRLFQGFLFAKPMPLNVFEEHYGANG